MAQKLRCMLRAETEEENGEKTYGEGFTFDFGYASKNVTSDYGGLGKDDCVVGTNIKNTPIFSNEGVKYQAFDGDGEKLGFYITMESLPTNNRLNRYIFSLGNDETGLHMLFYDRITGSNAGQYPLYLIVPSFWSNLNPTSLRDLAEKIYTNYYVAGFHNKMYNNLYCGFMFLESNTTDLSTNSYVWSQSWGRNDEFYHNLQWGSSWYKLITNEYMVKGVSLTTVDDFEIRLTKTYRPTDGYLIDKYPDNSDILHNLPEPIYVTDEPILGTDLGYVFDKYGVSVELNSGSFLSYKKLRKNDNYYFYDISMNREGEIDGQTENVIFKGIIQPPFSQYNAQRDGSTGKQNTYSGANIDYLSWINCMREDWSTTLDDGKCSNFKGTYMFLSPIYNQYSDSEIEKLLNEKISEHWDLYEDRVIGIAELNRFDYTYKTIEYVTGETYDNGSTFLISGFYFSFQRNSNYNFSLFSGSTADEFNTMSDAWNINGEINVDSGAKWLFLLGFGSSPIEPGKDPEHGDGSIGGGGNRRGGGTGKFNDKGDNIALPDLPWSVGSSGLLSQWYLGSSSGGGVVSKLNKLGDWLSNWNISSTYADRLANLCSLKVIYSPISPDYGENTFIFIKNNVTLVEGAMLSNSYKKITIGSFTIEEYFGNFLDYSPNTEIRVFLPFCGVKELNPNDYVGNTCTITAYVDWMYSTVTYLFTVKDKESNIEYVKDRFVGSCGTEIPLTSVDYGSKITSLVNTVISAGVAYSTGGPVGAAITGTLGLINSMQQGQSVTKGISPGPAGVCDVKSVYLMVTRPKMAIPNDFGKLYGWKSSVSGKLKQFQGFTKVAECHLEGLSQASSDEIDEIENLLKEGVILPK